LGSGVRISYAPWKIGSVKADPIFLLSGANII